MRVLLYVEGNLERIEVVLSSTQFVVVADRQVAEGKLARLGRYLAGDRVVRLDIDDFDQRSADGAPVLSVI